MDPGERDQLIRKVDEVLQRVEERPAEPLAQRLLMDRVQLYNAVGDALIECADCGTLLPTSLRIDLSLAAWSVRNAGPRAVVWPAASSCLRQSSVPNLHPRADPPAPLRAYRRSTTRASTWPAWAPRRRLRGSRSGGRRRGCR